MYTIEGSAFRYSIDEDGQVRSCYNRLTNHEYVFFPGNLWKLIYSEGERSEIPVFSSRQKFTARCDGKDLNLIYEIPKADGRRLDLTLTLRFEMSHYCMSVSAELDSRDSARISELQIMAVSGVRSLSAASDRDTLTWPMDLGRKVKNPAFSDLSVFAGFRKYERHDQFHTDMDGLYPGRLGMQWYDLYNEAEGLYVGCHNAAHETIGLHAERDVKANVLRMGAAFYPFTEQGRHWENPPLVYAPHLGDWHAGARRYRAWIESAGWKTPVQPEWMRLFKGWLRVILKQHHGELNWSYKDIPALYDEAAAAGLDTIFLLGWEQGGFARLWPDYVVDNRMGGEAELRAAIDSVHSKGGRVVMFLSYLLIDRKSDFYQSGKDEEATVKSIWGQEVPFSETYCGEGTFRKLGNPPMPMYFACPSSQVWQDKMLESSKTCLDLGADGVLFDLGMLELYRYTFPECIMTNRECGEDEENYRTLANHSFVYGLRFDMTIHRCCGILSDIPNYAAYLGYLNGLRKSHVDALLKGRFVDNEGFACDCAKVIAKGYREP